VHPFANRAPEGDKSLRSRVAAVIDEYFGWLAPDEARILAGIDGSERPAADGAAVLLGYNLWLPPLLRYREFLEKQDERAPPLWRFPFDPSARWQTQRWRALPFAARKLRSRAGSLAHDVEHRTIPELWEMDPQQYAAGFAALRRAGFCTGDSPPVLKRVADAPALRVDLTLTEVLVHWLRMLAHGDRVLQESAGNGFDVCGYAGACSTCRERWGTRPRSAEHVPPFHPGCRCFAQPRFAT
jgi:hypothetical protein